MITEYSMSRKLIRKRKVCSMNLLYQPNKILNKKKTEKVYINTFQYKRNQTSQADLMFLRCPLCHCSKVIKDLIHLKFIRSNLKITKLLRINNLSCNRS